MENTALNTEMSVASDSTTFKYKIYEKRDESEVIDTSDTEESTSELLSGLKQESSFAATLTSSLNNKFDENQEFTVVKSEQDKETSFDFSTGHVLSMFPFVCGICDLKVNSISTYLTHFQMHENVSKYLHCCVENDKTTKCENPDLYVCGACGVKYPSLCTLYKHLVSAEGAIDFDFCGDKRTAYVSNNASKHQGNYYIDEIVENIDKVRSDKVTDNESETVVDNDKNEEVTVKVEVTAMPKRTFKKERKSKRKVCNTPETSSGIKQRNSNAKVHITPENDGCKKRNPYRKGCSKLETDSGKGKTKGKVCSTQGSDISKTSDTDNTAGNESENGKRDGNFENCYPERKAKGRSSKVTKRGCLTRAIFPCETCGKMLKYKSLKGHTATHQKHVFPCDLCDLKFQSVAWMRSHRAQVHVDDKKFTCDKCGKSFKALAYLRQHSQTHLKERNVKCPICAKMFLYKNVLRIHLLTHSENRPHHCNICGKGFKRQHDILVHKEGVHEAVEKYPCTQCDKKFITKDRLRKHRLIHQPPKFSCQFCGKTFVQNSNMRIHLKVHRETT